MPAGSLIVDQGQTGREAFVLLEGNVTVKRNGKKITTMGPGSIVGELSLLDHGPRTATVTCETDCLFLLLSQRTFLGVADARGRWGSCRQPRKRGPHAGLEVGRIRYSWRLVLAPYEVMDYVAAHECAHLLELNHGPRFWAHVRTLVGDPRRHRDWLRAEGARLHAFGR